MTLFFYIVIMCLVALTSECATHFWCYIIGSPHKGEVVKGRILSRVGLWLDKKYETFEYKEDERISVLTKGRMSLNDQHRIERKRKLNFWKITGLCPVCTNPYFTFITWCFAHLLLSLEPIWWSIIPVVLVSNYHLRISLKK